MFYRYFVAACVPHPNSSPNQLLWTYAVAEFLEVNESHTAEIYRPMSADNTLDIQAMYCNDPRDIICQENSNKTGCFWGSPPTAEQCNSTIENCVECYYNAYGEIPSCAVCAHPGVPANNDTFCSSNPNNCGTFTTGELCASCPSKLYMLNNDVCQEACVLYNIDSEICQAWDRSSYLLIDECVPSCPSGYIQNDDNRTCDVTVSCAPNCAQWEPFEGAPYCVTCNTEACILSCPPTKAIVNYKGNNMSSWVASCPPDTIDVSSSPHADFDSLSYPACFACSIEGCKNCIINSIYATSADPISVCTNCPVDGNGNQLYFKVNDCVSDCGMDYFTNTTNNACEMCPSDTFTFNDPSTCEGCGDQCVVCQNDNGSPLCAVCPAAAVFDNGLWLSAWPQERPLRETDETSGQISCVAQCPAQYNRLDTQLNCLSKNMFWYYLQCVVS